MGFSNTDKKNFADIMDNVIWEIASNIKENEDKNKTSWEEQHAQYLVELKNNVLAAMHFINKLESKKK